MSNDKIELRTENIRHFHATYLVILYMSFVMISLMGISDRWIFTNMEFRGLCIVGFIGLLGYVTLSVIKTIYFINSRTSVRVINLLDTCTYLMLFEMFLLLTLFVVSYSIKLVGLYTILLAVTLYTHSCLYKKLKWMI